MKVKVDGITLGSSYEALFYGLLKLWEIPVEQADRAQAVPVVGDDRYCPDFYLPELDIWVEAKGVAGPEDPPRWAAWRDGGRRLALLGREDLRVLIRCGNGEIIRRQLNNWATDKNWTPEGQPG